LVLIQSNDHIKLLSYNFWTYKITVVRLDFYIFKMVFLEQNPCRINHICQVTVRWPCI